MQINKLLFLVVFLLTVSNVPGRAQEVISCASYYSSNSTGSFSGSVGETFISEISDSQNFVSQGFQQPMFDFSNQIVFPTNSGVTIKISPNPVMDQLTFIVNAEKTTNMTFTLSDIKGNAICEGKISSLQTQLNVSDFPAAIYLLKIKQNNILISSAKIIKH